MTKVIRIGVIGHVDMNAQISAACINMARASGISIAEITQSFEQLQAAAEVSIEKIKEISLIAQTQFEKIDKIELYEATNVNPNSRKYKKRKW